METQKLASKQTESMQNRAKKTKSYIITTIRSHQKHKTKPHSQPKSHRLAENEPKIPKPNKIKNLSHNRFKPRKTQAKRFKKKKKRGKKKKATLYPLRSMKQSIKNIESKG